MSDTLTISVREPATTAPDAAWVRALQRREPWAWERLHQEAVDPVFAYIFARCPRREDAEDLTAEVFAAAVAAVDRFRGDCRVTTWLIGIAHRKLADAARRRVRRPEVLETELALDDEDASPLATAPGDEPGAALERRETLADLRQAVLRLPDAQREALLLRAVDQLSLAETARVLRCSEDAVKGLLRRAKQAVIRQLKPDPLPRET